MSGHSAVLVSIPKSGTHLITSVLTRLGYVVIGVGGAFTAVPEHRMAKLATLPLYFTLLSEFPLLTSEQIVRTVVAEMAARVLPPTAARLPICAPLIEFPRLAQALARVSVHDLFQQGIVLSVHDLWFDDYSGRFIAEWADCGRPKLVFNIRDPRDQLISMTHFLRDSPAAGVLRSIYGPILRAQPSFERQLAFAMSCPTFPFRQAYRRNAWMLHHPEILKVRFEDLVGADGGGDRQAQQDTIARIGAFLGLHEVDTDEIAAGLFGGTKTFRTGRLGEWRTTFNKENQRAFQREFGDVISLYNYL